MMPELQVVALTFSRARLSVQNARERYEQTQRYCMLR